jgi:hypothetical protein
MTYSTLLKEAEKLSATEIKAIFKNRYSIFAGTQALIIRKRQRHHRHVYITRITDNRQASLHFHTAEDVDTPVHARQLEWHQNIISLKDLVITLPEENEDGSDRIIAWNGEFDSDWENNV